MSARQVLSVATMGGARVLGQQDDLGSLEVGKLADIALWRIDGVSGIDIADPVCTLIFGTRSPLELLLVGGRPVVENEQLVHADIADLATRSGAASATLATRAGLSR